MGLTPGPNGNITLAATGFGSLQSLNQQSQTPTSYQPNINCLNLLYISSYIYNVILIDNLNKQYDENTMQVSMLS